MGKAHRLAARRRVMLRLERGFWRRGLVHLAGVDEAGVGSLAGPLVAAAVILPVDVSVRGIDDSKRLTRKRRERMAEEIRECAVALEVGVVSVKDVDRLNVYRASLEAMRRAVVGLPVQPEQLLVDARHIPELDISQMSIIKGDSQSYSIAAASIIAKVTRDEMMRELDQKYPEYGFAKHMGYGTKAHLEALKQHGPSPVHRRSFAIVRQPRLPGL